jgi:hypothetical protein
LFVLIPEGFFVFWFVNFEQAASHALQPSGSVSGPGAPALQKKGYKVGGGQARRQAGQKPPPGCWAGWDDQSASAGIHMLQLCEPTRHHWLLMTKVRRPGRFGTQASWVRGGLRSDCFASACPQLFLWTVCCSSSGRKGLCLRPTAVCASW